MDRASGILRKALERIDGTVRVLSVLLTIVAGAILIFIIGLTVADIVSRNLNNRPISRTIGYSEVALVLLVYLGLGPAARSQSHIRVSVITDRLRPHHQRWLSVVAMMPIYGILLWMSYRTGSIAFDSWQAGEVRPSIERAPVWPARIVVTIGLVTLVLESILYEIKSWLGMADDKAQTLVEL